ncbi:MAG: hypothetical protein IKY45_03125 [Clostridia bacterium]|nr:hypothetical protein [Clostridia bacterium]
MKKYDGILKRVHELEKKQGIVYARTNGKLCVSLKIIYLLIMIFATLMNFFYIIGMLLINFQNLKNVADSLITTSILTLALIAAIVLNRLKLHTASAVLTVITSAFLIPLFVGIMEDVAGFLDLKTSFYWRHFTPLLIAVILAIWIAVISLREKKKVNFMYKKVEENLYNIYHTSANEISKEQWSEFLENYNGESPAEMLQ